MNDTIPLTPAQRALLDVGKRVSDEVAMHKVALGHDAYGKWIAVRLSDGTSDHEVYPSKYLAVRHQHHDEQQYAFIQITPASMTAREAAVFIETTRRLHDAGFRLPDPDSRTGGRDMIRRLSREDQRTQVRAALVGDVAPSNISYGGPEG